LTGLSDNSEQFDQTSTGSLVRKMGLILYEPSFAIKAVPMEHRIKGIKEAIEINDPLCVILPSVVE
jgi:hypothetical protein